MTKIVSTPRNFVEAVSDLIASCFPDMGAVGPTDSAVADQRARVFLELSAALHDIGKISKPFARQVVRLADQMAEEGLVSGSNQSTEAKENRWMKHALAGAVALSKVGEELGWNPGTVAGLATIAGGHHGTPVKTAQFDQALNDRLRFLVDSEPSGPWRDAQREFALFSHRYLGSPDLAAPVTLTMPALVLIQALVMMADWISSPAAYFPLTRG